MNPVTVCAFASELLEARSGWAGGKLNATSTFLEPLSAPECVVLIENLVGQAELTKGIETSIADAADANPLLVEEMLAVLIDDGVLVPRNGRWVATGNLPAVLVPPTIHALLAARLDRLDPDERIVVERAAVQGKIFHDDAVARTGRRRRDCGDRRARPQGAGPPRPREPRRAHAPVFAIS